MNMSARFDENPAMTLQDIKETKCYRWTHARMQACTDNVKTVYPPQTKFAGGIRNSGEIRVKNATLNRGQKYFNIALVLQYK